MSDQKNPYVSLLSQYHSAPNGRQQSETTKREMAVAAALSLLDSHAQGGTGTSTVANYKTEVGPLADAIQEALKVER